jgi:TonB-linked SusC/RagA family outer membrane protein
MQVVFAQSRTITGRVSDADDGSTLPGVSVVVKGTSIGTVTDIEGKFSLNIPQDAQTLVLSFVGMEPLEAAITSVSNYELKMQKATLSVDEVVVTAMGISRDVKAVGYAATTVSGDAISNVQAVNPMSAIQGKVAGVQISSGTDPGSTQNIFIRGASSFSNNQPLFIVDGIPLINEQIETGTALNFRADFGSGLNAINPDNIANMTILKGAAATALYGSRAANGVILITTKTGRNTNGKMVVNYNGSVGISRVGRIPSRQSIYGQGWSGQRALDENGNWGAPYDGKNRVWGNVVDNSQLVKEYKFLEDRVRDFYDFGLNYKNSVALSGGDANTNYFLSLGQNSVDGVIPTDADSYKRYTISTKGSHKTDKFEVLSSVNFVHENTKAVQTGQGASVFRSIWEIAEDISIVDLKDYKAKYNNLDDYFTPYGINPYFALNENGSQQGKNKVYGKFELKYNILENLNATYRFSGDIENSTTEAWIAKYKFSPTSPNFGTNAGSVGSYENIKRTRYEYSHDFLLNYNTNFSPDLSFNAIVGTNINERGYDYISGKISSVDVDGYYNFSNSLTDAVAEQFQRKRRLIGVFASADISYKNYAFVSLTARNDWSSTLPLDNNSFFYPGATASFVITDFLAEQSIESGILSFAKIRAAYGWTGNDADPYQIYPVFESAFSNNPGYPEIDDLKFPLNNVNSYTVSNQLGNNELKPEITKEVELGVDVRFFNNRLGFDVALYDKTTHGLITTLPIDPSSGYTFQLTNLGDVNNKGIEFMTDIIPVKTKNFQWNINYNFSKNVNKVVELAEGEITIDGFGNAVIIAKKGEEVGLFKTYVPRTVEIDGVEKVIVDGNGNVMQSADMQVTDRSVNEDFAMGLSNSFTWKGLSLSATLDFHYGGYIYSYTKDYMHWTGSAYESTMNNRNPFVVPNSVVENADGTYSENTTPVTQNTQHTFYGDYGAFESDLYSVIDRSYLKLRDVGLSYQIPNSVTNKININDLKISFVAGNILLWTPADNCYIDPETTTFGNDLGARFGEFGSNPSNQTYLMSLSFKF